MARSEGSTTLTPELPWRPELPSASTDPGSSLGAAIFPPPSRKPQFDSKRPRKSAAATSSNSQRPPAPRRSFGLWVGGHVPKSVPGGPETATKEYRDLGWPGSDRGGDYSQATCWTRSNKLTYFLPLP